MQLFVMFDYFPTITLNVEPSYFFIYIKTMIVQKLYKITNYIYDVKNLHISRVGSVGGDLARFDGYTLEEIGLQNNGIITVRSRLHRDDNNDEEFDVFCKLPSYDEAMQPVTIHELEKNILKTILLLHQLCLCTDNSNLFNIEQIKPIITCDLNINIIFQQIDKIHTDVYLLYDKLQLNNKHIYPQIKKNIYTFYEMDDKCKLTNETLKTILKFFKQKTTKTNLCCLLTDLNLNMLFKKLDFSHRIIRRLSFVPIIFLI